MSRLSLLFVGLVAMLVAPVLYGVEEKDDWAATEGATGEAYAAVERNEEGIVKSVELWDFYTGRGSADPKPFKLESNSGFDARQEARLKIRRLSQINYFAWGLSSHFDAMLPTLKFVESSAVLPEPFSGTSIRKEVIFRFLNKRRTSEINEELYLKLPTLHRAALLVRQSTYLFLRNDKEEEWTESALLHLTRHLFTDYGLGKYEKMKGHEIIWKDDAPIVALESIGFGPSDEFKSRAKEVGLISWEASCRAWKEKNYKELGPKALFVYLDCGVPKLGGDERSYKPFSEPIIIAASQGYFHIFTETVSGLFDDGKPGDFWFTSWQEKSQLWKKETSQLIGELGFYISAGVLKGGWSISYDLPAPFVHEFTSRYPTPYTDYEQISAYPYLKMITRQHYKDLGNEDKSQGTLIVLLPDLRPIREASGLLIRGKAVDALSVASADIIEGQRQAIRLAEESYNDKCSEFRRIAKNRYQDRFLFAGCDFNSRTWELKNTNGAAYDYRLFQFRSEGRIHYIGD